MSVQSIKDKINNKKALLEAGANSKEALGSVQQFQQQILGMAYKLYNLEQRVEELRSMRLTVKLADIRSLAIMKLLDKVGITEDDITRKADELQTELFEKGIEEDDKKNGHIKADDETLASGMHAIVSIKFYKEGAYLEEQGITRAKTEIGKEYLFKGFDAGVTGMKVGESRKFEVERDGEKVTAEPTLLGIRKAAPAPEGEQAAQPAAEPDQPTPATETTQEATPSEAPKTE